MEYQQTAQNLKFDAHGLIPAIVQDHYTRATTARGRFDGRIRS